MGVSAPPTGLQLQMCLAEANVGEATNADSHTVIFITKEPGRTDEVSDLEPTFGQVCVRVGVNLSKSHV